MQCRYNIVMSNRETVGKESSCLLCVQARFEFVYCSLFLVIWNLRGLAKWHYGASTCLENINIQTDRVEPTSINFTF